MPPWTRTRIAAAADPGQSQDETRKLALMRLASPRNVDAQPSDPVAIDTRGASGLADWQAALLRYVESVPPLAAAARYYSAATQRVTYNAVRVDDVEVAIPSDVQEIVDLLDENHDPLARGVELLFLIGDTRGTYDLETQRLEMLSPAELYARGPKFVRVGSDRKASDLPSTQAAWRSYEPSLVSSLDAVSSNKALLDVFEAYRIAYGEERALSIRSAMNAGIVLISEDVFGSASTGEYDANGQAGLDPADALEERFQRMLSRTIDNPRNSAGFAPPVLSVPGDVSGKVGHYGLAEKRDTRMLERRLKALREEIAIGIDLPADVAAGFFADMNHWNGHIVNENAVTNHIAPKIELVAVDAFHEIASARGVDVTGWTLSVDYSNLLLRADTSDVALEAHAVGLISDRSAREATGFDETDAPSDENPNTAPDPSREEVVLTTRDANVLRVDNGSVETLALKGADARRALATINVAMESARARLQRDVQKYVNQLWDVERADVDADLAAQGETFAGAQTIIDNIARSVLGAYETMGLGAARGIATKEASSWYSRTRSVHEANATRAAQHAQTVVRNMVKATPTGSVQPSGFSRQVTVSTESVGSGQPASLDTDGKANGTRPGIISEQEDWLALLEDEIEGDVVVQYTWAHGGSPDPFPAHLELDGVTWFIEDERTVLNNDDSFPDSAIFYPGDHRGCTCEYDADMVLLGEDDDD